MCSGTPDIQTNPFKYGDVFGLTKGPLSGDVPGKLTETGINLQDELNPGIGKRILHRANDLAPAVAAIIAGGSIAGSAEAGGAAGAGAGAGAGESALGAGAGGTAAGSLMPAAVPESAGTLSGWGLTETAPGVFENISGAGAGLSVPGALKGASTVLAPASAAMNLANSVEASRRMKSMGGGAPTVPEPRPTPIMGSPTLTSAEQAALEAQLRRRGRASTVLTQDNEKLGQ